MSLRTAPEKPFDGAVSRYFESGAPPAMREALLNAGPKAILSPSHPYRERMGRKAYQRDYRPLQIELVKLQHWVRDRGTRLAVVFEGRDSAGKGGVIKRLTENLNPRGAHIAALPRPSDVEAGQWYFQRYIARLPNRGEIVFYDRSWYNRAVVEHVFGFCTPAERERFFAQVGHFEEMLVQDGIRLLKIWLTLSRPEQLRRFLAREADPLKQWKLSRIDVDGLSRFDDYSEAIAETFARTHLPHAPWTVIRGDDKRRARLAGFRTVLGACAYDGRDAAVVGAPDPLIAGPPSAMPVRED